MISFAQPIWLAAGPLACAAAALFMIFSTLRRRKMLEQFAAPHLLPLLTANVSTARRRLKNALFLAGLACLFLALARPQWGHQLIELRSRGIDILIGFDVSKSMLASDVKPSRLQRAKLAVRDFTAKLDGDRIGLLPFAGASFLLCPLTADYEAFNASLDSLDTDSIPKGGTDIGKALEDAANALFSNANHKIFILITDGEDLGQNALKAAELAKKERMIVYAVGVGTPQGELIPLPGGGPGNFVKDGNGAFVTSKLDEAMLAAIAEKTGGSYVPLGSMGEGLDIVHERKLALIPKEEQGQRMKKVPMERFQWPLATAVLLFSLEFLLIGRRSPLRLPFIATAGRRWRKRQAAAAALAACVFCAAPVRADEGGDLFQAGKYKEAAELYQRGLVADSGNPALHFNLGAALHKQGSYGQAAEEFSKALLTDDLALQEKSYYNRGISQYEAGRALESADLSQTVRLLQQAKQSFAAALQLMPENKKAASNLQMVEQKLAELEQRRQEQQSRSGEEGKQPDDKKEQRPDQQEKSGKQEPKPEDQKKQQDGADKKQDGGSKEEQKAERSAPPPSQQPQAGKGGPQKKENGQQTEEQNAAPPEHGKEQQQAEGEDAADRRKTSGNPQQGGEKKGDAMMTGRMTEEEARSLLDSLKGEQGELNFMPQEAADNTAGGRDW